MTTLNLRSNNLILHILLELTHYNEFVILLDIVLRFDVCIVNTLQTIAGQQICTTLCVSNSKVSIAIECTIFFLLNVRSTNNEALYIELISSCCTVFKCINNLKCLSYSIRIVYLSLCIRINSFLNGQVVRYC